MDIANKRRRTSANAKDASGQRVSETTAEMSDAAGKGTQCDNKKDAVNYHGGDRLKFFNKVMEKAMERFIGDASFQRFAHSFKPLCKDNPLMEGYHKQFTEELQGAIQGAIDTVIDEGDLKRKLDELDKLELEAKDNKESAWRPSGMPNQDLCCFVMPYYQKQHAYLVRELKKIQGQNAVLAEQVQAGRDHITQTSQHIATAVDEWKASVSEIEMLKSSLCHRDIFDV